jgi:hypothetical protein
MKYQIKNNLKLQEFLTKSKVHFLNLIKSKVKFRQILKIKQIQFNRGLQNFFNPVQKHRKCQILI